MALFGSLLRGFSALGKIPFLGTAMRAAPGVGAGLAAVDVGMSLYNMGNSGNKNGSTVSPFGALPPLPANISKFAMSQPRGGGGGLPAIQAQHAGQISQFSGKGKRHGLSPSQAFQMLAQAGVTLGPNYWKQKICAPPGYVMVHDPISGAKAAVPKRMAIDAGLWKPAPKPPISVRQWHALKHAKAAIKHLHKVEKAAHIVTHATTRHAAPKAIVHHKRK